MRATSVPKIAEEATLTAETELRDPRQASAVRELLSVEPLSVQTTEKLLSDLDKRIQSQHINTRGEDLHMQYCADFDSRVRNDVENDAPIRDPYVMRIGGASFSEAPAHYFAITRELVSMLRAAAGENGRTLSEQQIYDTAMRPREARITSFDPYTLNHYNDLFYSSRFAFTPSNAPAPGFVCDPRVTDALLGFMLSLDKPDLRVKEVCTGARPDRWRTISDIIGSTGLKISATLSDFETSTLPTAEELPCHGQIDLDRQKENLLLPLEMLSQESRYDMIFSTYGADSLWFPGDCHYEKRGDKWFRATYALALPDTHVHPERFRNGGNGGELLARDVATLVTEMAAERVDIDALPYGQFLKDRAGDATHYRGAMPAGLADKVDEIFRTQLKDDGVLLLGDVGAIARNEIQARFVGEYPFHHSGGAKYRGIDFSLLKELLQERGYVAELRDVSNFCTYYQHKCRSLVSLGTDHAFIAVERGGPRSL